MLSNLSSLLEEHAENDAQLTQEEIEKKQKEAFNRSMLFLLKMGTKGDTKAKKGAEYYKLSPVDTTEKELDQSAKGSFLSPHEPSKTVKITDIGNSTAVPIRNENFAQDPRPERFVLDERRMLPKECFDQVIRVENWRKVKYLDTSHAY